MAARESSTSSGKISSHDNDVNEYNLFDSDVAEISKPSDDVGPRPYRFEPRRVRRNVQEEANEKQPRVRRIAFNTLTGNCFNCDLLAFFEVNAYDRQYLVRIKANPIHVFPFLLFWLCLS